MNRTIGRLGLIRRGAMMAAVLGLWAALVVLFAAPLALAGSVTWRESLRFGASFWVLWLAFLPAVAWLAFRFPMQRSRLLRNLGVHLLACLLVVGTSWVSFRVVARLPLNPPLADKSGRSPGPPRPMLGAPGVFNAFRSLRAALDVLVYWSLFGVCVAITNYRKSQERERRAAELETRLVKARLQALRGQIHPHFLFNTLNSIAALVYLNPRAADEMLGDLSELLRRSLDSMAAQEVTLAEELDFVGGYVRIEQRRLGDRLQVELSVPDELRQALVPSLVLQPLVENAIRHGIEPRRGPGRIRIEARRDERHLHLVVEDDGAGLTNGDRTSSAGQGIGLANTRARLEALYGPDQKLALAGTGTQGCRVEVQLPYHLVPFENSPAAPAPVA